MRRGWAFAGAALMLAPARAQPADEARQALATTRTAGLRAQAEAQRFDRAAAAADVRVGARAPHCGRTRSSPWREAMRRWQARGDDRP